MILSVIETERSCDPATRTTLEVVWPSAFHTSRFEPSKVHRVVVSLAMGALKYGQRSPPLLNQYRGIKLTKLNIAFARLLFRNPMAKRGVVVLVLS